MTLQELCTKWNYCYHYHFEKKKSLLVTSSCSCFYFCESVKYLYSYSNVLRQSLPDLGPVKKNPGFSSAPAFQTSCRINFFIFFKYRKRIERNVNCRSVPWAELKSGSLNCRSAPWAELKSGSLNCRSAPWAELKRFVCCASCTAAKKKKLKQTSCRIYIYKMFWWETGNFFYLSLCLTLFRGEKFPLKTSWSFFSLYEFININKEKGSQEHWHCHRSLIQCFVKLPNCQMRTIQAWWHYINNDRDKLTHQLN